MILAIISSLCSEPRKRLFALILGIPTIVFSLGGRVISGSVGAGSLVAGRLCEVLSFFGAAALIVKSLFRRGGSSSAQLATTEGMVYHAHGFWYRSTVRRVEFD